MSVILKCKICGGDIELNSEQTIGTCMYCGSQLTLPKIADTQRIDAFNRGNHFRRIGEFDNALTIYEQIINEDKTDAEAHWCAAISRFGIEYVEDPSTMEYIPTCHRASFDSFLDDVDYKAAIEFSEGVTRRQYQKDGMRIDEVQKAILSTSQKEDPFDVFICYKEADAVGERTQDSVLAQDIYERLSEKGYRVFFSRITLEEKVGTEFEPYIFAALNSAKVMVVVGTSRQNLDSVWVKNEWGRFLALMKKDNSKVILPCYKDIDPYEMPEGLAVLQSYNMASIGFIQDLIRGIEKIVNPAQQLQQHTTFSSIDVNALKKRIRVFLDNKDFKSANEYCNKVLDALPEDGETYALKLCSEVGVSNVDKLCKSRRSFDNKTSYTNAVKFGDKELRSLLESQNSVVRAKEKKKRNRIRLTAVIVVVITIISASLVYLTPRVIIPEYNKYKAYQDGKRLLKDKDYTEAYKTFVSLGEYKNSSDMAKEVMYVKASDCMDNADYDQAISIWETIPEYKDSLDLIEAAEEAKYDSTYQEAIAAMGKQDYETAVELFKEVNEYKDAKTKIIECKYQQAKAVFDDKDYDEAWHLFNLLGNYSEAKTMANECSYLSALDCIEKEDYESTIKYLLRALNYKDVNDLLIECIEKAGMNSGKEVHIDRFQHDTNDEADAGLNVKLSITNRSPWQTLPSSWGTKQHCYIQIRALSTDDNAEKDLTCLYVTDKDARIIPLGSFKNGDGATVYLGDAIRPLYVRVVILDKENNAIAHREEGQISN